MPLIYQAASLIQEGLGSKLTANPKKVCVEVPSAVDNLAPGDSAQRKIVVMGSGREPLFMHVSLIYKNVPQVIPREDRFQRTH